MGPHPQRRGAKQSTKLPYVVVVIHTNMRRYSNACLVFRHSLSLSFGRKLDLAVGRCSLSTITRTRSGPEPGPGSRHPAPRCRLLRFN